MNENQPAGERHLPVKKFPFRFSPLMLTLCIIGLVLAAAGFGVTTWQFVKFLRLDISSVYEWMKFILLYLVSILLGVLLTAMLIKSQYIVDDRRLTLQFGLIRQRYELKKIRSVHHFCGARKLAVYFDDYKSKYIMIVVSEAWFAEFADALIARCPHIEVTSSTPEEEEEFKKKK